MTSRSSFLSVARALIRPMLFFQYLAIRQILNAGAFPSDEGRGSIEGPDPQRLVVIGEATAVGYGTVSFELSIAGQLARKLAAQSGRGVEWIAAPFPDFTVYTATKIASSATLFVHADLVVVMLGIGDAIRVTPARTWERLLGSTLDEIRERLPEHARIVIAEIPPLDYYRDLPRPVRVIAGRQARRLNELTRELASVRPGCDSVEFPAQHLPDVQQPDKAHVSRVYSVWASALLAPEGGTSPDQPAESGS